MLTNYIKYVLLRPYVSQIIETKIHAPEQSNFFPVSGWDVSLVKTTPTNNSNEVQIVGGENSLMIIYPQTSRFWYMQTKFGTSASSSSSLTFSCEFGIRTKIYIDYIS